MKVELGILMVLLNVILMMIRCGVRVDGIGSLYDLASLEKKMQMTMTMLVTLDLVQLRVQIQVTQLEKPLEP